MRNGVNNSKDPCWKVIALVYSSGKYKPTGWVCMNIWSTVDDQLIFNQEKALCSFHSAPLDIKRRAMVLPISSRGMLTHVGLCWPTSYRVSSSVTRYFSVASAANLRKQTGKMHRVNPRFSPTIQTPPSDVSSRGLVEFLALCPFELIGPSFKRVATLDVVSLLLLSDRFEYRNHIGLGSFLQPKYDSIPTVA